MNPYLNLHPTSPFGERTDPISGQNEFHPGCDYRPVDKNNYTLINKDIDINTKKIIFLIINEFKIQN
ncbi:MAG: hypothetical protein A2086_16075 [Spirochaetes bacterium GWD1_27_9]|nr:MAG: hypothetical protein A2Z98_15570 [Spirochaetes bacterium GWB1_27_13]OHD24272.1 MAG: hypothetical protein A2Y34_11270 [Spirochaetes bacterium GWC1_27_15]OHD36232.1 MAG: hypothetical protein A2086_16075 [Spirochaetes bacterium GWD1_27_9]